MIIDDIIRDEQNEIWAICGKKKVQLSAEYIATNKPQIGDELIQEEPKVEEASAEEPK